MKQSRSRQTLLTILLILLGITAVYFGYQAYKNSTQLRGCTMEAKVCPDGSSVGRSGPLCEFTPCPITSTFVFPIDPITGWSIYSRIKNFTFQFPSSWTEQPNFSLQSDDALMSIWIEGDRVGLECLTLTKTLRKIIKSSDFTLNYYDGIENENCSNGEKKVVFIPFSVGSNKYSFTFDYNKSNQKEGEKLLDQILSTFRFIPEITDPQLQTLVNQLNQLIAKEDFYQIANLVKMTETTCDSQAPYYNPTFCDGVADGTKKSGYSVGLYQSEGTVQDKNTFIEGLQTFFTSKSNPTYLGAIITSESSSPSGFVWKNTSDNNFLSFFVSKTDNSWGLSGVLIGEATPEILNLEKFW